MCGVMRDFLISCFLGVLEGNVKEVKVILGKYKGGGGEIIDFFFHRL